MKTNTMAKALGRKNYLAMAIPLLMAAQAHSVQFDLGQIEASVDSQFSLGSSWRTEDASSTLVDAIESTDDDGNRNFEKGDAFSQIFKGSHDLQFSYQNFGAFVRGKYWYDSALANNSVKHGHSPTVDVNATTTSLADVESGVTYNNNQQLDDSNFDDLSKAQGVTLLDAFVYGEFELGEMPLDVRLGKQVVSWGESTFIIGGINNINPADLSAFRRPGAELKEGLLPVGMAYANLGLTDNLSLEGFYQYEYQNTVADACGTFFSTSDISSQGCNTLTVAGGYLSMARDDSFAELTSDDGQFGIAMRYFADSIETEFGFYAMTTHSRLPIYNINTANDGEAYGNLVAEVTAGHEANRGAYEAGVAASFLATEYDSVNAPGVTYAMIGVDADNIADGTSAGGAALTAAYNATVQGTIDAAIGADVTANQVAAIGLGRVINANYFMEYPEDNKMLGVSFSTNIGGFAVSGEVSHKMDSPVQISGPLLTTVAVDHGVAPGGSNAAKIATYDAIWGDVTGGDKLAGFRTFDITQVQTTVINRFSNIAGASSVAAVMEVGMQYVHDFDDTIKFGRASFFGMPNFDDTDDGFVSESSWGYRALLSATYNNVFAGVDVIPTATFKHDVKGTSAGPGGPFLEGNQSLGLSVKAIYLSRYSAALAYTQYEGGDYSVAGDRDFASVSVDVQF